MEDLWTVVALDDGSSLFRADRAFLEERKGEQSQPSSTRRDKQKSKTYRLPCLSLDEVDPIDLGVDGTVGESNSRDEDRAEDVSPLSRTGGGFEGLEVVGFVGIEGLLVRLVERVGRFSRRAEDAVRILGKKRKEFQRKEREIERSSRTKCEAHQRVLEGFQVRTLIAAIRVRSPLGRDSSTPWTREERKTGSAREEKRREKKQSKSSSPV